MGKHPAMSGGRRIDTAEDLAALGARLAKWLRIGDVVCLRGPLGAGKTTLARGLIRALTTADEEVPSPTFTLVQTYAGDHFPIFHFDLYRLTRPEEVYELGLEEALDTGVALIEWPERMGDGRMGNAQPPDRLDIEIALPDAGEGRMVALTAHGAMTERGRFE